MATNPNQHNIKHWYQQAIRPAQAWPTTTVVIFGRVKTNRSSGNIGFLEINDGSVLTNLQVVYKRTLVNFISTTKLKLGTCVVVKGQLILTSRSLPTLELQAQMVKVVQSPLQNLAIQKSYHTLSYLRKVPTLRLHTKLVNALNRIKSFVIEQIHDFFTTNGFYHVTPPIISNNDVEGGGEVFYLSTMQQNQQLDHHHFFNRSVNLTVSSQMHLEALAQSLSRVYTITPIFRAEESATSRHAAEFLMLECELINSDLTEVMAITERLIRYIIQQYLRRFQTEITFLETYHHYRFRSELARVSKQQYRRLSYDQVIKILHFNKNKFKNRKIFWGMNLELEHEKFIAQHIAGGVCFITDFPQVIKPFYMKTNFNRQTVLAFDLLTSFGGELVGGSVREDNYDHLQKNCQTKDMNAQNLKWYLDLRLQGYAPSVGFGLGFERLVMYLTKITNIRDIISFPKCFNEPGI